MGPVPFLSVLPGGTGRGGPPIQHLRFLAAMDRDRFAPYAVIRRGHAMAADYARVSSGVFFLDEMPLVPRATSPAQLWRYSHQAYDVADRIAKIGQAVGARFVHTLVESFPPGPMAARRLGIPSLIQVLGMTIFHPPWVAAVYAQLLAHWGDRIIGCQDVIPKLLHRYGVSSRKLRVVYNGIDPDGVRAAAASGRAPDLPAGRLRVGMVAGLDARKGHLLFIEAAARAVAARGDVDFYIIGSISGNDAYLERMRALIARHGLDPRLRIVGPVENPYVWMAAMDVYCIPSLTEALSVAGMEAMAVERPLVATNVDGNPIEVLHGQTGLLSRPADAQDLAAGLLTLLADPALRRRMGQAGRRRADNIFEIRQNTRRLEQIFTEVLRMRTP